MWIRRARRASRATTSATSSTANDGIITTFAVVSGVAGGSLSHLAVLVVGVANLAADGMSMGVGNCSRYAPTSVRARPTDFRSIVSER